MSARAPRVSVVMTVFDGERFLAAAIESILAQTLHELELIVVDDGSRDASLAIAEDFAARDPRVRVAALAHVGLAAALNHGLALAVAPLVARMDADDLARPDRLRKQVAFLDAHPAIGVVGGQYDDIDAGGRFIRHGRLPEEPARIRAAMRHACVVWHPTTMMRRELVLTVGGYRAAFESAEDYDLWLRLLEHTEIANLPDVVLDYRWHGGNVSAQKRRRQTIASLMALGSAIGRKRMGVDPCATLTAGPTLADLEALPLDRASRAEWLALIYLFMARRGPGDYADILAWLDAEAREVRRRTRDRDVLDELARAHLNRAVSCARAREPIAAITHLVSALRSSPRIAWERLRAHASRPR